MKPKLSASAIRDLLHERLDAMLAECDLVATNEDERSQTLNLMETFFLIEGRKFIKETFELKLQERIEQTEADAESKQCTDCKKKTHVENKKPKTIGTAHGHVTLHRRRRSCPHCKHSSFPVEITLGLATGYSDGLKRLAARCCGFWSYRDAADNLEEFFGIHLCPTTLGTLVDKTSVELSARLENSSVFRDAFQKATGEIEFYADGTFIHIRNADGTTEWREVRVGAYSKRLRGASALPSEWATRLLQKPSAVSAFAAILNKEEFQARCQVERRRVGVGGVSSTLGDGAPWIWNVGQALHGKTDECLDIYHALEHVSACSKVLYGSGAACTDWYERMRLVLLSEGFAGVDRELLALGELDEGKQKAVSSLREYLRKNEGRLNYARRLSEGRAIGSGLIEGACKNLVGRRMKQTGACWRLERANRIAVICALLYSKQWKQAWEKTA